MTTSTSPGDIRQIHATINLLLKRGAIRPNAESQTTEEKPS
jgi:hypothetical protein